MKRVLLAFLALVSLLMTACNTTEVKRETGYKGKARLNPWLAAERFMERKGHAVRSSATWVVPEEGDAVCFMPSSILNNEGFVAKVRRWVENGGHLVLLVDDAEVERNDWYGYHSGAPRVEEPLREFLTQGAIKLSGSGGKPAAVISFEDRDFQVAADSRSSVKLGDGEPGVFASAEAGNGRVTVVTDAKIFRSRWIGDHEHAALLNALVESSPYAGSVSFIRGSGLSLGELMRRHLAPMLIGLAVATGFWLWKSFSRFGPVEPPDVGSPLRGYDHHLEALGDFQWRLDRGAALLGPLREQIVEAGQRLGTKTGRRDDDFFQLLADRAGLPRERVFRALAEAAPADSAVLTRTAADLQQMIQSLRF